MSIMNRKQYYLPKILNDSNVAIVLYIINNETHSCE